MNRKAPVGLAVTVVAMALSAVVGAGSGLAASAAVGPATAVSTTTPTSAPPLSTCAASTGSSVGSVPTSDAGSNPTAAPASSLPAGPAGPVSTAGGAVDPNAPEVVEPGDIPDNQVFVAYSPPDASYTVKVPEGWARTEQDGAVTFTDNYNSVTVQTITATTAPTVDCVRSDGLADVSSDPTFSRVDVAPVTREVGDGVLATYEIGSEPNAVTGRSALLSVERYFFFGNGTTLVLTLSGAKGADNVDPWRIVSDSVTIA